MHSRVQRIIVHKIKTEKSSMNLPTYKVFGNVCGVLETEVLLNGMEERK